MDYIQVDTGYLNKQAGERDALFFENELLVPLSLSW